MDVKALLSLVEPLLQEAFDSIVFQALSNEVAKVADPILKQALQEMLPGFKKAIDGALQEMLAQGK